MQAVKPARPAAVYALILVLMFLSVGALYGGYSLMTNPESPIGLQPQWLEGTGFSSYFIPGLILFVTLGILPLVTIALLWYRPEWTWMEGLEHLLHIHWVWGVAVGIGVAQLIWIIYQVTTMGLLFWLQPTMFGVGLLIVGLCVLPSVRGYFYVQPSG